MVAYNFIFICLHIRDLSNNALSSTVQGMNGAFTGLQKLIMLWVLCLSCWMCYCNKVILIFWTKNKRFKLTWYRYFLFIFFFTLKISSNFWLCKACHIYNFLKCYSGIKSTKHYCTHPVDMAKTSIQLLLWLSFCVMSSLHFTGSICDLLRIRNLRQLDIMCCAFLLCKFPWEIKKWFNKIFCQETWWKSYHLDSCQCILWTKSHAKLVSTFFITNKYKQSLLENFPNLSKIIKVGKETTMETFGSIYAHLPRMEKLLHVHVFPNIHWPSKFICGFHAEISLTMMKTLPLSFNVALKS